MQPLYWINKQYNSMLFSTAIYEMLFADFEGVATEGRVLFVQPWDVTL